MRIAIQGTGAVSPAGWSTADLCDAVKTGTDIPATRLEATGLERHWMVRRVPAASSVQSWLRHPRLRRASPISRFATAAALEALGGTAALVKSGELRLGVVYCVMAGCVNYSGRFYREVITNPSMASPLIFPETVFNAPASHLAALLESPAINYTLVSDDSGFFQGLAIAAGWLSQNRVDGCLVVAAEECDWLTSEAMRLFERRAVLAEGAGAVYLQRADRGVVLEAVTDPHVFAKGASRSNCLQTVENELASFGSADVIFDSATRETVKRPNGAELRADALTERISLRNITGNGFAAASAWQMILAASRLADGGSASAVVSVTGCNHAAIGVRLRRI